MKPTAYPVHYCNTRHNPKYPCPTTEVHFGGVPASRLPACDCEGFMDHDPWCARRAAIAKLMNMGHNG